MELLPRPKLSETNFWNSCSRESRVFLISTATKQPPMFYLSKITKISEIDLVLSAMYLSWRYAFCSEARTGGSTDFSFAAKTFEKSTHISI